MGKTYMTDQINNSATIHEIAGAAITAVRGKFLKYSDGKVVASGAGNAAIGVAIITNNENLASGDSVDIQVKDIGLVMAGGTIAKGAEIASDANGKAVTAAAGDFVMGTALEAGAAGQFMYFQINKYQKPTE